MMSKNQLIFDPADLENSDEVGARLLAGSDGSALTSTTAGPKEALDVNLAGSDITLDIDPGAIQFVQDGSVVTVLEDTVTPANNRPLPVSLSSTSGPINITAGDLNVQLSHSGANPDSTQIGDGTETVAITPNSDMQVADFMDSGLATSNKAITDSAAAIVTTSLSNRKYLEIQNLSKEELFIGLSGITSGTGYRIPGKSSWSAKVGAALAIEAIRKTGKTGDIRILEMA